MGKAEEYIAKNKEELKNIKKCFNMQLILIIVFFIAIIVLSLLYANSEIKYLGQKEYTEDLESISEMKDSMIMDLQEDCNNLYTKLQNYEGR